jgi:hypothetical protein
MRPTRFAPAVLALAVLTAGSGCGHRSPKPSDQPTPGPRTENPALGLALAQVPVGFEVARNEGTDLVLERSAPDDHGRLSVLVGPPQKAGVNLVDQVWKDKARIEALPDGKFEGQNELGGSDLGTVYTCRGRYTNNQGQAVEDYRALAVYPGANRLLTLDYEYPAPAPGTTPTARLQQLMEVLQQVEPLGAPAGASAPGRDEGQAQGGAQSS